MTKIYNFNDKIKQMQQYNDFEDYMQEVFEAAYAKANEYLTEILTNDELEYEEKCAIVSAFHNLTGDILENMLDG